MAQVIRPLDIFSNDESVWRSFLSWKDIQGLLQKVASSEAGNVNVPEVFHSFLKKCQRRRRQKLFQVLGKEIMKVLGSGSVTPFDEFLARMNQTREDVRKLSNIDWSGKVRTSEEVRWIARELAGGSLRKPAGPWFRQRSRRSCAVSPRGCLSVGSVPEGEHLRIRRAWDL